MEDKQTGHTLQSDGSGRDGSAIRASGLIRGNRGAALEDRAISTIASLLIPPLCVLFLMWPAFWNSYPIVFADTGTYLSQAMHHYLGWDRPVFYSVFILPLHLGLTTWPVVLVQAAITVLVLDLARRAFGLAGPWLLVLTAFLSSTTWLPWTVSELMPDLFTPLLILLLSLLVFAPHRFRRWERVGMIGLAAFMIATQQSSVPLACAFLFVATPSRLIAAQVAHSWQDPGVHAATLLAPLLAPVLAMAAMILVNTVGYGRVSLSPYGNVFLLARVIYDGPGMDVLRRECPESGWKLCPWLDRFPATSDEFLWNKSSPIMLAGGHKAVSADADAIIRAAVTEEPDRLLAAAWDNTIEQLLRFASGDGLETWDAQVGSWIETDFPERERARFHSARQQLGTLSVPPVLGATHQGIALTGIAVALVLLPIAWRQRHLAFWFLAVSLLILPLGAAITGGLSTPHDRYQSRIVWLPACIAFLSIPALIAGSRRRSPIPASIRRPA
jgi:hypothetical protein